MKQGIHPDYHEITVVMTNGKSYKTRSTWGKAGESMRLDIDPNSHPAWTGGTQKIAEGGQISKFSKRFEGLKIAAKPTEAAAKPAKKEAKTK